MSYTHPIVGANPAPSTNPVVDKTSAGAYYTNMSLLPALLLDGNNSELALSRQFLDSLQTPADYENAFGTITQQKNTCIWWEADLILDYYQKFLGQVLDVYRAGQLLNSSTVKYYLRTASGFPPELRIPSISFNHHYQATFADEWDSKTLHFNGDKRFVYSEKAADDALSTRQLRELMDMDQRKIAQRTESSPCDHCLQTGETSPFTFYKNGRRTPETLPQRLYLHDTCYQDILTYAYKN